MSEESVRYTHFHIACPALYPLPYSRAAFRYIFTALDGGDCDDKADPTDMSCVTSIHPPPHPPTDSNSFFSATKSTNSPSPPGSTDCRRNTDVAGDGNGERDGAVVHAARRDDGSVDFLLLSAPDRSAGADVDAPTVRRRRRGAGTGVVNTWEIKMGCDKEREEGHSGKRER